LRSFDNGKIAAGAWEGAELGHLGGQGFLIGFLTILLEIEIKIRSQMEPPGVVGIQFYPFFRMDRPNHPRKDHII
jgi:hypothetical protein